MEWISRFVLHVDSYFLLSTYSKWIIQWTLAGLIVYSLLSLYDKKWDQPKNWLYVGVIIRFVLMIGLSIEMFHQVHVTQLAHIYWDKEPSVRQFLHFMFFGYIVVVGFYYMMTIHQSKNKGLFYTFDILLLTMPILQLLTGLIFSIREYGITLSDVVFSLVIVLITGLLIYLFYVNYWGVKWYAIITFYVAGFSSLVVLYISEFGNYRLKIPELTNLFVFLVLLMTYHFIIKGNQSWLNPYKKGFKIGMVIVFLFLINPIYNLGHVALAKADAEVQLQYFESAELITLKEAEGLARKLTGDQDFFLRQSNEDFHNRYPLVSKNYDVDIHGMSGTFFNLGRKTPAQGQELSDSQYVTRSKQVLNTLGRKWKEDSIYIEVSKGDEGATIVTMRPQLADGTPSTDDWAVTTFYWEKESLMGLHEEAALYSLESLKGVSVTEAKIERSIKGWYGLLGQVTPEYALLEAQYDYGTGPIELKYFTKTGDAFTVSGKTAEVLRFSGNLSNRVPFETLENTIISEKEADLSQWKRTRAQDSWYWSEESLEDSQVSYRYTFEYKEGVPAFSYSKNMNYRIPSDSGIKAIDREEAFKAVAKKVGKTSVYAKRAKLTQVINDEGEIRKAWLVVIQPFGTAEHKLYLVDVETNKVDALYEK
ncbi:hypothetical protein ACIQZI_17425 [Peribacillus sp. NPDC096379]|uniref:hypothetical protein n=1 Tax=Peribacillus sp. NPDC096379 TaxID=3364393 RepID=UPI00381EA791